MKPGSRLMAVDRKCRGPTYQNTVHIATVALTSTVYRTAVSRLLLILSSLSFPKVRYDMLSCWTNNLKLVWILYLIKALFAVLSVVPGVALRSDVLVLERRQPQVSCMQCKALAQATSRLRSMCRAS